MKIDAVIFGASGYGGGELLRWLSSHPNVARIRGTSRSRMGRPFYDAHPNLRGVVNGQFEEKINDIASGSVVFSALPHGELAKSYSNLRLGDSLLVDLSTDFRASPDFVYGLPEWNREAIRGAKRIASAGCFATALQIALLPLRGVDVGFVAATAVTGSSGSGASASAATHHPTRANDFRAYKVLSHQHMSEVNAAMRACEIKGQLSFVPQSGPFVRGIFATLQFAHPPADLRERATTAFANEPFVRLVEETPRISAVVGSNFADVAITTHEHSAAIMVALDNLGKGMASQAVQSMNIALGLPETTGLWTAGRFPA